MARLFPFLVDFSAPAPLRPRPVNDVVMGGRSMSRFRVSDGGIGIFEGKVSLENGGGFASVRAGMEQVDLSGASGVTIRVRGDGQRYRLILRNDRSLSGVNWQQTFQAPREWAEVHLPFSGFEPSLRGRRPSNPAPLNTRIIRQVGLMIADRQAGPFRLEVAWIRGANGG